MMVPTTPHSILKKNIEKKIQNIGLDIKIIEKPGSKLLQMMQNKVKKENAKCEDNKCLICASGGNSKLCRSKEVVYTITCKDCEKEGKVQVYDGETGRNGMTRGNDHQKPNTWLHKHVKNVHGNTVPNFKMEIVRKFQHDPLARQVCESIMLKSRLKEESLNDR